MFIQRPTPSSSKAQDHFDVLKLGSYFPRHILSSSSTSRMQGKTRRQQSSKWANDKHVPRPPPFSIGPITSVSSGGTWLELGLPTHGRSTITPPARGYYTATPRLCPWAPGPLCAEIHRQLGHFCEFVGAPGRTWVTSGALGRSWPLLGQYWYAHALLGKYGHSWVLSLFFWGTLGRWLHPCPTRVRSSSMLGLGVCFLTFPCCHAPAVSTQHHRRSGI